MIMIFSSLRDQPKRKYETFKQNWGKLWKCLPVITMWAPVIAFSNHPHKNLVADDEKATVNFKPWFISYLCHLLLKKIVDESYYRKHMMPIFISCMQFI